MHRVVIDTNVIISALRSKHGASNQFLRLLGKELFESAISVPLILEYEEVCKRLMPPLGMTNPQIDGFIDYICQVNLHRKIFYLWRPQLPDADNDFLLDLAVEAQADFIITFNKRDFPGVERFNIRLATPKEFMQILGVIP
jgi:putative PIN family toxin of toxin-antitoxin system